MPSPRLTFRAQLFFAALASALIALGVAGVLFATTMRGQIDARIEQTLVAEARLAAELLARGTPAVATFRSSTKKPIASAS